MSEAYKRKTFDPLYIINKGSALKFDKYNKNIYIDAMYIVIQLFTSRLDFTYHMAFSFLNSSLESIPKNYTNNKY